MPKPVFWKLLQELLLRSAPSATYPASTSLTLAKSVVTFCR